MSITSELQITLEPIHNYSNNGRKIKDTYAWKCGCKCWRLQTAGGNAKIVLCVNRVYIHFSDAEFEDPWYVAVRIAIDTDNALRERPLFVGNTPWPIVWNGVKSSKHTGAVTGLHHYLTHSAQRVTELPELDAVACVA